LSVFQRKWRALPQFQQTRGTLAMLAQWISWAAREHFDKARQEPLITLGSAPLHIPEFRAVVLGQLGETRLDTAILADIAGEPSHARALDADTRRGPLRDIHRRVGTAILFESSGGQVDKVAHLPELRFALGEPEVETTSVDNAAAALEAASYFLRKVGTDGFRIHHQATLKKVVADRRASLDEETEVKPEIRKLVAAEIGRGANVPVVAFPEDSGAIQDAPRLILVIGDPEAEWSESGSIVDGIAQWTRERVRSPRLYPASLIWCAKKPGRELRDSVEIWLAWRRVAREVAEGVLGTEFDRADRSEVQARLKDAEEAAKDEVWSGYRYVILSDTKSPNGLKVIDLGAGHASASETLCGRIIDMLKTEALLNDSIGAGYIDRHWPRAFEESGAWPLGSLRQSFLNGTLTRLIDPDNVLRRKILEFVERGDFGLASGPKTDGSYERSWCTESVDPDEVAFDSSVFLLTQRKSQEIKTRSAALPPAGAGPVPAPEPGSEPGPEPEPTPPASAKATLRLSGTIPPEIWNRLGTKVLPKLRSGDDLRVGVEFTVTVDAALARNAELELQQILAELGLADHLSVGHF
jgi:hypothetical protein